MRRFAFRLALAHGIVDVDGMLESIPWTLFDEWREYDELEPISEYRADLRMGMLIATVSNMMRKQGSKAAQPSDFMPFLDGRRRQQTPEEMQAVAKAFIASRKCFKAT